MLMFAPRMTLVPSLLLVILSVCLFHLNNAALPKSSVLDDDSCPQLPQHIFPLEIGLYITPDLNGDTFQATALYALQAELYGFTGDIATFVMYAEDLTFSFCQLVMFASEETMHDTIKRVRTANFETFSSCAIVDTDKDTHQITVNVGADLIDWKLYRLHIDYTGKIRDDMTGFYETFYKVGDEKRRVLATQFQPTHAPKVFPCFDEPLFKSNYSIEISISNEYPNYHAISNMPEWLVENDGNAKVFVFYRTPPISSYLIAWVVSDFDYREDPQNNQKDVAIRTYTHSDALDNTGHSLQVTRSLLEFLEDYTSVPYLYEFNEPHPLNKIDQVAVPDFSGGAMENWGLITYRETALLYNNGPETARRRVSIVIAHELAHMWFGNLVTTARWDTTWLNEGFAEYFEYLAVDSVHEGWRMREQFVVETLHSALVDDAIVNSPALTRVVCSPADAAAAFHSLTYTKGASVLRMFSYIIGEDNFRKAIKSYINNNAFKAVEPEDLFRELKVYNEEAGLSYPDMNELLYSWTEQNGYPMVLAMRNYEEGTVDVKQMKYESYPEQFNYPPYFVPLTWTQRGYGFEIRRPQSYLTIDQPSKTITGMPDNNTWIIFNVQQTGFYRVMYDLDNWELLINYLNNEAYPLDGIHLLNRAHLVDDIFAFGRSGRIAYGTILRFMDYLRRETDYIPWVPAFSGFSYMNTMLVNNAKYPLFKQYVLDLILNIYNRFEFTSQTTHIDNLFVNRVSSLACTLDHPHCIEAAKNSLEKFLDDNEEIPANLRSVAYCHGIRNTDDDVWQKLWNKYLISNDEAEKTLIMNGLGCSSSEETLEKLLEYSIDETYIRKQDGASVFSAVYSNPKGVSVALNFLSDNFSKIKTYYGAMGAIRNIVTGIAERISTIQQQEKMMEFLATHEDDLDSTAAAATQLLRQNAFWVEDSAVEVITALEEKFSYRLPTSVLPEQYNLRLTIQSNNLADIETFDGDISILVSVKEATQSILLHTQDLTISDSDVSVTRVSPSTEFMVQNNTIDGLKHDWKLSLPTDDLINLRVVRSPAFHLIKLVFDTELNPGEKYYITIKYTGPLRNDMVGFYKTYYTDDSGGKVYLLATKFAPVHARKAFPCFDEPSFKARFQIDISIPSSLYDYGCISNAAEKDKQTIGGSTIYEFENTPVMSTYIVAWEISDLQPSTLIDEDSGITFTTWARKNAVETAQYSLQVTPKMLKKLSDFTGYPYYDETDEHPLKKLDQVGTPDFVSGAMENWGLITYRETALLYKDGAPEAAKKRAATVIAHELAHMWFGNLVTCAWWEATWLNEGFAQYFQYLVTDHVEPWWNIADQFVVDQLQSALALDAESTSKPLTHRVVTPSDAVGSFASLTYSKGASFLRMLSFVIGEENFETAIKSYVSKNKYQAATPDDLFKEFLPFADNAKLTEDELLEFLHSWTEQPGFPVLYVTRHYDNLGTVTLTQERFLTTVDDVTPQLYYIPLSWLHTGGIFDKPELKGFLTNTERSKQLTDISENGWMIFNTQHVGYFRVMYDDENWRRLTNSLSESFQSIHWLNRAQLLDDAFTFARYGRMSYAQLIELTDYIHLENEYIPWAAALSGFATIDRLLSGHRRQRRFQAYVLSLVEEAFNNYGYDTTRDTHSDKLLVAAITARACAMGHKGCQQTAVELLQDHIDNGASIHSDVRGAVYCHGIRHSSDEYWEALWEEFSTVLDEAERALLLTGLGCSASTDKLRKLLESTIKGENVRKQEATSAFAAVYATKLGADVTLEFLRDNYEEAKEYLGSVDSILTGLANRVVTDEQKASLVELVKQRWWEGLSASGPAALKTVDRNFAWYEDHAHSVIALVEDKTEDDGSDEESSESPETTSPVPTPPTTASGSFLNVTYFLLLLAAGVFLI